jgi:hypothetical protein
MCKDMEEMLLLDAKRDVQELINKGIRYASIQRAAKTVIDMETAGWRATGYYRAIEAILVAFPKLKDEFPSSNNDMTRLRQLALCYRMVIE